MKKIIRIILSAVVIIIIVLLFNTLMLNSKQVASETIEKISLPNDVFQNLSKGLQYPTISYSETSIQIQLPFLVFIGFLKRLSL